MGNSQYSYSSASFSTSMMTEMARSLSDGGIRTNRERQVNTFDMIKYLICSVKFRFL